MRVIIRVFNEVHTLVGVVYIVVSIGAWLVHFSLCFLYVFVLEAYVTLLLVGYEYS